MSIGMKKIVKNGLPIRKTRFYQPFVSFRYVYSSAKARRR